MAVIVTGASPAVQWARLGRGCAGGAPDDEGGDTAVVEAPAKTDERGASETRTDGGEKETSTTEPAAAPESHTIILPDGSESVPLNRDQVHYWAARGMEAARKVDNQPAPEEVVEEKPPVVEEQVDSNEDPIERRVREIEAGQVKAERELAQLKAEREEERNETVTKASSERGKKTIAGLITKHAEWADDDSRDAIEGQATIFHRKAAEGGAPLTDEQAIEKAAKWLGEKTAAANRAHEEAKQHTRDTAAEGPRGAGSIFGGMAPAKPMTKEERRKSAEEMEDGTADQEAKTMWREYANAPAG